VDTAHIPAGRGIFVGLATLDVVQRIDAAPEQNRKITADWQSVSGGGPALNAAVTFAALGGSCKLLTVIGQGTIADAIRSDLQTHDVSVSDCAEEGTIPAVSSILLDRRTGDRIIVSTDGTGQKTNVPENLDEELSGAAVVLLDGHHPSLALAAAAAANRLAIPVVVDAGRWKPVMVDLLPLADTVICSSDFRTPGGSTSLDVFAWLADHGVGSAAVTAGREDVMWQQDGRRGALPVPRIEAVDTLGAGDVFHGAFCWAAAVQGQKFEEAIAAAARIASIRCSSLGPRTWIGELRASQCQP
jgi:sugar/nucleoside kinase (ribokinase family)